MDKKTYRKLKAAILRIDRQSQGEHLHTPNTLRCHLESLSRASRKVACGVRLHDAVWACFNDRMRTLLEPTVRGWTL